MADIEDSLAVQPVRRRLPDERQAIVHHFNVGEYEGYLTVGLYEDGRPGEIFITTAKEGSTVSGLMDCFATAVSLALQYGVSLRVLCSKFSHTRFEPSGWSGNPDIGYAGSLMDYIFRWLALKFLPRDPSFSPPEAGGRRWLPSLTSVAFVLPLFLFYWQVGGPSALLADPDTGLHIRTGDWIVAHHQVPRHDLYSFTIPGKPWCDWEWLSDVLFSILHRCGGLAAITAFSFLVLCLTSMIVYRTARLHASRTVALGVTYVVIATTTIHWLARPHLLTWLLVALFCRVLDDSEFDELSRRWLLLLLLMAVWANLHGGFIAGLMVIASYMAGNAAGAALAGCKECRAAYRQRVRGYTVLIVACLAATLINPYFTGLHHHIASYLFSGASVTGQVS